MVLVDSLAYFLYLKSMCKAYYHQYMQQVSICWRFNDFEVRINEAYRLFIKSICIEFSYLENCDQSSQMP